MTGGSGLTGKRGVGDLAGFEGAATGRVSAATVFAVAFGAAFGAGFWADFGAGLGDLPEDVFAGAGNALTADFGCALADFPSFGRALEAAAFDALTVEPEAFAGTGFAGVERFGSALAFSLETAAPFDFDGTAVFTGLTGAASFFGATAFFPTSCRDFTDFSPVFAAGLDDCFEAVVFFAATTSDDDAFGATAFTAGFTLDAAPPACDDGRDLEVSLGVGFTGVFPAGWRLLAFAGEFLIESLYLSIL